MSFATPSRRLAACGETVRMTRLEDHIERILGKTGDCLTAAAVVAPAQVFRTFTAAMVGVVSMWTISGVTSPDTDVHARSLTDWYHKNSTKLMLSL